MTSASPSCVSSGTNPDATSMANSLFTDLFSSEKISCTTMASTSWNSSTPAILYAHQTETVTDIDDELYVPVAIALDDGGYRGLALMYEQAYDAEALVMSLSAADRAIVRKALERYSIVLPEFTVLLWPHLSFLQEQCGKDEA